MRNFRMHKLSVGIVIRRVILSWLLTVTILYAILPAELKSVQNTDGVALMSFSALIILSGIFFFLFTFVEKHIQALPERQLIFLTFSVLAFICLVYNFTWSFFFCCLLCLILLLIYAIFGWKQDGNTFHIAKNASPVWWIITVILAVCFIAFVSVWTVCRIYCFSTPTFDFGIFSQMFYHMKASGIPLTTVERDGLLSHFYVHVSPIYYLLLPFYCLIPYPATLQILQAIILGSAVIPLYKIAKHHGIPPAVRVIVCGMLLFYPAYSGGTSYDIHENAFLTPLLLWLLYGIDRKSTATVIIASCLTLLIKEDAAVYVTIIALYVILKAFLGAGKSKMWELTTGSLMFIGSVLWFLLVTHFLANIGDGVMTYRYSNFMYNNSGSLLSVIKAVLMCPMKVLFEAVDTEKIPFIFQTMFPLLGLPLFTRRFERYILLIPYILINLMSDYRYQHDIFFQYTFGSTACLFYLTTVNLAELSTDWKKFAVCFTALICSVSCFVGTVLPKAIRYPTYCLKNADYYAQIRQTLDLIPDSASVAATTFYTTHLSQREILYDVKYCSTEHLLSAEYVALATTEKTNYAQYNINDEDGYTNLCSLLESYGYEIFACLDQTLVIYKKAA